MAMELDQVFVIDESPAEAWAATDAKMNAARATGDERARALCLIKMGEAAVLSGDIGSADGYIGEATSLCGEMKFEEGRAAVMNVMAKISAKRGGDEEDLEEALDSATDALKLFKKVGFRKGEAAALTTLASVQQASKKAALAIKSAKEALAIFAELGEKRAMAEVYSTVKSAYLSKSPPESFLAAKQMEKAMALYQELGDKSKEAACMHEVGVVEKQAGSVKKAAAALQKAKDLATEAGDFKGQAAVLETMMEILLDNGLYSDAVNVGKERITIFRNAGDASAEGHAMLKLGDVAMKNGDYERADKLGQAAMGIFASVNDMEGLKQTKDLVDGAKHEKVKTEIETSIEKAKGAMHVPTFYLVDPGMNKRIASGFAAAMS